MYTDCLCHRLYLHTSSLSDQSTPICHSPDHSTQTLYHFLCLGSAGGYSNYFWNDSRKPAEKSSDCEPRGDDFAIRGSVSQSHNNQFLLWVQSGLAPLINHRSDLALIIKYQFYLFLCFGSTSTLSCHVASLGYRSRSRRYTTVLEVVTSHT